MQVSERLPMSDAERADLKQKQIQLERAKTVLSLFELQAKRERENAERAGKTMKRFLDRDPSRQSTPPDVGEKDSAFESEISDPSILRKR